MVQINRREFLMNKLRIFEAFSGYGSQSIALRNLGIDYEVVAISEIDKYAIQSYEAIHGKVNNLGDISKLKVEDIPKHDLFTYSFPCQDISVAGKMKGIEKGKTRSGLLYECEKIIEAKKPKYLLMENVKNLVSKKFKSQFDEWLKYLEELGYTNYWKILNSKNYGIPQNRERVFVVSILGEHKPYKFNEGFKLDKRIKDLLEDVVDEKYYLSKEIQERFKPILNQNKNNSQIIKLGNASKNPRSQAGLTVSYDGISMTICSGTHGYAMGYLFDGEIKNINNELIKQGKIRRYTPKECFRLMGLSEEDINKIQSTGLSDTQQYKLAGNSIVVQVLESIFRELLL